MEKIASPKMLQEELTELLHYAQSDKPSREVIATKLNALAERMGAANESRELTDFINSLGRVIGTLNALTLLWIKINRENTALMDILDKSYPRRLDRLNDVLEALEEWKEKLRSQAKLGL